MQYPVDFNPVGGYTIKQDVAFDGDASRVMQAFGVLASH